MPVYVTQDRVILYVQQDGAGTAMAPLSVERHGMADKVHPGPGRSVIFGRDAFGRYVPKITQLDPPGGLNTSTIEEDGTGDITYLATRFDQVGCFPVQERYVSCGRLDVATNWDQLWHYGNITITQKTHGAGPVREAAGAAIFDSYEVSWPYTIELLKHALTLVATGETEDINDIAVLSDLSVGCTDCFPGYTPDDIIYLVGPVGTSLYPSGIIYSLDGGSTWADVAGLPFDVDENITQLEMGFITDTQFRIIVANDANDIRYADVTLGAEEIPYTWSAAVEVGTVITEMRWLFFNRLYVAADGDIYLSDDQGVSFGSAIYSGTPQINAIERNYDGSNVWAVGASNLIIRERNSSSTFDTMVGPTGGGTFYSVFEAADGRLYAGNGQSIYVSTNGATTVGGWTELRDFGTNKTVIGINCAGWHKSQGGDSQLIRVAIDDTASGTGAVWETEDGGASWRQLTTLANAGYNAAWFSPINDNLALIGGDDGILHRVSPEA